MCKVFLLLRSVGRRDLSAGPEQKKHHPWCCFLLRPRGKAGEGEAPLGAGTGLLLPLPFPGAGAQKNTMGGVFFFAVAPPGRSLTHCGLGRFRQGPGGDFFFLLRPRRVFLDNNKKCLGYYIGSAKTRRGHSKKKKNTTSNPKNPPL